MNQKNLTFTLIVILSLSFCFPASQVETKLQPSANQVKGNFFRALDYFVSLSELQKMVEKEVETLKKMRKEKSVLTGEIAELENRKTVR